VVRCDFIAKLTTFGKQMRVLESFYSSTNLSKKTKIAFFYGTEEVGFIPDPNTQLTPFPISHTPD
jgi:hypothetical protein